MMIWVGSCNGGAFSVGEVMDALVGEDVDTDVMVGSGGFGEFVRVAAVAVDVAD